MYFDDVFRVWFAVAAYFQFAIGYTAALRAYGVVIGDEPSNNLFMQRSQEALLRQLYSEISKIFDAASTGKYVNCSINRIRQDCEESGKLSDKEKEEIVQQADELNKRYEEIFSKNLRNKKLAHYDLEDAWEPQYSTIAFDDIEKFVTDTAHFLNKIGSIIFKVDVNFFNYNEQVESYRVSILELTKNL